MFNWKKYLKIFKKKPTLAWNDLSGAMHSVIKVFVSKRDKILEFGSSTGHISFKLAKEGYNLTLLDIRQDVIEEAKKAFRDAKVKAEFFIEDVFLHDKKYSFCWNSGLIQCLDDEKKERLIKKLSEISPKILLFYPDTESPSKQKGTSLSQIPGVGDANEYGIMNIPDIAYMHFRKIYSGRISGTQVDLPFDMFWLFAEK
jgi:SAM-dependent methyltransferase